MSELTEEEKKEAYKVVQAIVDMWWSRIQIRMIVYGEDYEEAFKRVKEEILK